MPVETEQDRLTFLNPDEFGVEAIYVSRKPGAEPTPIPGVFDDQGHDFNPNRWNGTEYQMQNGAHIVSTAPTFTCRTSDLVDGGRKNERLTINGTLYKIHEKLPDGTGFTKLVLMADDE
jgi:hypothetical protein